LLGAETIDNTYIAAYYELTNRDDNKGRSYSIGFASLINPTGASDFLRYSIPFQGTFYRGRQHCWEMGAGLLFAHGWEWEDLAYPAGTTIISEALYITWTPIGYRFADPSSRLTIRIFPYLARNTIELNDEFKQLRGPTDRLGSGDITLRFCFNVGWALTSPVRAS
jgi:hypothetical protein